MQSSLLLMLAENLPYSRWYVTCQKAEICAGHEMLLLTADCRQDYRGHPERLFTARGTT